MEKITTHTYFWDIETSKIITDCGYQTQITFLSNVLTLDINNDKISYSAFFRTIKETINYFKSLPDCIVWVHNLDYELTFLLRELIPNGAFGKENKMYNKEGQEVIFRDKNAPLSITLEEIPNVTFRDSYALFNKSVASLGEEFNLPKLDYNYKKVRLPWDVLSDLDYKYNERDNEIVALAISNFMKKEKCNVNEIPLTFTSLVRKKRKDFIKDTYGKNSLNKFYFDRNKSLLSFNHLETLMSVYQGGLTASNYKESGKVIDNKNTSGVIGIDIKSSYPNQMCTMKFPFYEEDNYICGELANEIFSSNEYKYYFGVFKFTNIRVKKEGYLLPISSSQISKGEISYINSSYNGKLISADFVTIPCNEVDIEVIKKVYDFDQLICEKITYTNKTKYLRKEEVAFLLTNFLNKETKSGDEKAESKLIINCMYGVKVSNPIKDFFEINDGEINVTSYFEYNNEDREKIYNNFIHSQTIYGGSLDVYSHGVYITSYARKQLIDMICYIVDNGGHVVYSDTDSIKFYCNTKQELDTLLKDIINKNEEKIKYNMNLPRYKGFKNFFNISDEEYKIISTLGIWEVEDEQPHKCFITLGAKKYGYITHDDKVKTTIAGCNKKNIPQIIKKVAEKNDMSLEESLEFIFSPGTTFDETASGRTTAYKEKINQMDMISMTYEGKKINAFGGVIINDTTYTLNVTLKDSQIINYNNTDISNVIIDIEGDVKFE